MRENFLLTSEIFQKKDFGAVNSLQPIISLSPHSRGALFQLEDREIDCLFRIHGKMIAIYVWAHNQVPNFVQINLA